MRKTYQYASPRNLLHIGTDLFWQFTMVQECVTHHSVKTDTKPRGDYLQLLQQKSSTAQA